MKKKLIIVADDFGLTESINNGVIKSYNEGIVTEISLMVDTYATEHAVKIIKDQQLENIGLHMMLVGVSSGTLFRKGNYVKLFLEKSSDEIEELALKELKLFEDLVGRKPTHICPQNGIHGNLKLLNTVVEFAEKHNIAVRIPDIALKGAEPERNYAAEIVLKRSKVRHTDHLFAEVLGSNQKFITESFIKKLQGLKDHESAEILLHPGYFDQELIDKTSLLYERSRDLSIALDKDLKKRLSGLYELIPYKDL